MSIVGKGEVSDARCDSVSLVISVHTLVTSDHLCLCLQAQSSADAVVSRALGHGDKSLVLREASGVFFVIDEVVH